MMRAIWYGRAFELRDEQRTIVLPCPYCGNPCFEPDRHTCEGLTAATLQELSDRDLDAV